MQANAALYTHSDCDATPFAIGRHPARPDGHAIVVENILNSHSLEWIEVGWNGLKLVGICWNGLDWIGLELLELCNAMHIA